MRGEVFCATQIPHFLTSVVLYDDRQNGCGFFWLEDLFLVSMKHIMVVELSVHTVSVGVLFTKSVQRSWHLQKKAFKPFHGPTSLTSCQAPRYQSQPHLSTLLLFNENMSSTNFVQRQFTLAPPAQHATLLDNETFGCARHRFSRSILLSSLNIRKSSVAIRTVSLAFPCQNPRRKHTWTTTSSCAHHSLSRCSCHLTA